MSVQSKVALVELTVFSLPIPDPWAELQAHKKENLNRERQAREKIKGANLGDSNDWGQRRKSERR
jgi:hypothetical protein